MSAEEFLTQVQRETDLDSTGAAREATRATLETFGERLARGEAEDIAEPLPPDFRAWLLETQDDARELSADEFVARVADREDVSKETAQRHAQAVFDALAVQVPHPEMTTAKAQLPESYEALL